MKFSSSGLGETMTTTASLTRFKFEDLCRWKRFEFANRPSCARGWCRQSTISTRRRHNTWYTRRTGSDLWQRQRQRQRQRPSLEERGKEQFLDFQLLVWALTPPLGIYPQYKSLKDYKNTLLMGSLGVLNKDGQITMSKCFCCRNNDGMLSKTEVLESQGVFVASQVGDFQI